MGIPSVMRGRVRARVQVMWKSLEGRGRFFVSRVEGDQFIFISKAEKELLGLFFAELLLQRLVEAVPLAGQRRLPQRQPRQSEQHEQPAVRPPPPHDLTEERPERRDRERPAEEGEQYQVAREQRRRRGLLPPKAATAIPPAALGPLNDAMNTIRTKNQLALICRQASLTERYVLESILHYVARMNVETFDTLVDWGLGEGLHEYVC